MGHNEPAQDQSPATYRVTVQNVTGHTTVGDDNEVVGDIATTASRPDNEVTQEDLDALHSAFVRVREVIEGLDGAGEREKGAAVDRLEELEAAVTDDEPDVRTMDRVRQWFAGKLPSALGAVTGLLLHPTAGLLAQSAGEHIATAFDGLLQRITSGTGEG